MSQHSLKSAPSLSLAPGKLQKPKFGWGRCDNCFARFPRTQRKKRFCSDDCRKEFFHHGSAFGPLRVKLEKMIAGAVKELRGQLESIDQRLKRLEAR